jgi:cytochrome c-type biogenesis protein CcmH
MMLGVLVVVLTVAVAIALTRPWWSHALAARMSRERANVVAYRTRLAEIEQELAAGNVDAESAQALKLEQQQRLLQDATQEQVVATGEQRSSMRVALMIGLLLPVFAGVWYYLNGSWRAQEALAQGVTTPPDPQAAQIEGMVQRLAQKLQQNPDDAEGWAMLGRSYFVLKRYEESAQAYDRANQLKQSSDPDLLVAEGAALALAADGDLSGKPRELFDQALKVNPDHMRALWFAGQSAAQAGDATVAQAHWQRLLKQDLPDELRATVEQQLQQIGGQGASARSAPPAAAAPSLHVNVALAPALANKRKPDQVLYVFAKAEQGPPMPLAVQKLKPTSWPVAVTLDDSMAMAPALKLSGFDRWIVTARLGAEGSPMAQSGDLQGQVVVSRGASPQNVDVVINQQVQ